MTSPEPYLILAALKFQYGYLIGFTAWQSAIRIVMVFVNSKLKEFMENALPDDRAWVAAMLNHRAYRILGFLLNALVSAKLPSVARKTGDTTQFVNQKPNP